MRAALPVLIAIALFAPRSAEAGKNIGVLVTGEHLKNPTQQQAEKWLRGHQQKVVTNPMPSDAVKILLDCFVLDDPKCMRSVVDARSTTHTLVSIRIDIASKKQREVRITIDWFAKGHSPISSRRTCDECTEAVLRSTIDTMLEDMSQTAPGFSGQLKVTSDPPGLVVMLDNQTIGVTPLEKNVPVGTHTVKVVRDGRPGPEKTIEVESDKPTTVAADVPPAGAAIRDGDNPIGTPVVSERRSRLIPGLMIGIGVAGIGAGAALYLTSEQPTGKAPTYRDTKKLGIGVAAGGGALLLTGVIIILATKSTSGPTVSSTPDGTTVGWAGSF